MHRVAVRGKRAPLRAVRVAPRDATACRELFTHARDEWGLAMLFKDDLLVRKGAPIRCRHRFIRSREGNPPHGALAASCSRTAVGSLHPLCFAV